MSKLQLNSPISIRSYAKVNLTLDVGGRRPDGYHDLKSVMQTISLHDLITIKPADEPGIRVSCNMPGIPLDARNLAFKAASAWMERLGVESGLDIHIEKRIPMEAGLGGGSSNAAAVLTALNEHTGLWVDLESLSDMAMRIGSDVPYFLVGGTAFVRGRGEEVQPLSDLPTRHMLIVKPPFGMSTALAYQRFDEEQSEPRAYSARILECMDGTIYDPGMCLGNDLETPVFKLLPQLAKIKQALLASGAVSALMCGSGSAVFGLFDGEETARAAYESWTSDCIPDCPPCQVFLERTISRSEAMKFA
jgi:4-diphosphocytidyl-2-C-methyl-D-erythritol kinase